MAREFALASAILMLCAAAHAQEAPPVEPVEAPSTHFSIIGLAPDDELNIRATASAGGMLIGRLPLGALARNLGCTEVGGYRWCKIADMNDEKIQGWAAARYLQPADESGTPLGTAESESPLPAE